MLHEDVRRALARSALTSGMALRSAASARYTDSLHAVSHRRRPVFPRGARRARSATPANRACRPPFVIPR
ncbi:hypothetical protein PUN4_330075 [Paraburkholderia unamae]|nr:hypothetical protein PUN4_330075 [Paraburkholderia unamae]